MNIENENDVWAMVKSELTPVVTVPAPGGELTIAMSKRLPEAKRLERTEAILHGMIESAEASLENPRPGISNKLLTRPSQLAQGVSDVAKRREYETRHKETLDLLEVTNRNSERAANNARIAAIRKLNELDAESKGGKKGAKLAKEARGIDSQREDIYKAAKNRIDGGEKTDAAFAYVAAKFGATAANVKSIYYREKKKREGETRGKYNRNGKTRGRYNTICHAGK